MCAIIQGVRVESYIDCFAKGKCFNIYTTLLCTYLGNEGNSIKWKESIYYVSQMGDDSFLHGLPDALDVQNTVGPLHALI